MEKLYRFKDWKNNKEQVILVDRVLYPTEVIFEDSLKLIKPTWNVIDVGASVGYYTIPMAKRAKHVYAIEIHPKQVSVLRRNIKYHDLNNVTIIEKGIGGRREKLPMWEGINSSGGTKLYSMSIKRRLAISFGINIFKKKRFIGHVETETLDDLFKGETIHMIKMDIQGMEFEAISGAKRVLSQCLVFLVEIHRREHFTQQEILHGLREMGYDLEIHMSYNQSAMWARGIRNKGF